MTLPIDNADLVTRFDNGQSAAAIAREYGTSQQVISYRLRRLGRSPLQQTKTVSPARIRALRDNFGALLDLTEFLEQTKAASVARLGDDPGAKALERIGQLTDFIIALREITHG